MRDSVKNSDIKRVIEVRVVETGLSEDSTNGARPQNCSSRLIVCSRLVGSSGRNGCYDTESQQQAHDMSDV